MKIEVGMKFLDNTYTLHEVTRIDSEHKGFWHKYLDWKDCMVEGFLYNWVFEKAVREEWMCIINEEDEDEKDI